MLDSEPVCTACYLGRTPGRGSPTRSAHRASLKPAPLLLQLRSQMYTSPDMQVFAILPAAGLGTRMAGPQPKQFLTLDGIPILIHSLRAFAEVRRVGAIYVAVRRPEMERVQAQVAEYGFASRVEVVEGGDNRQESVAHALSALPAEADDIVLVHDAVRPLIDAATIERTIDAVIQHGAAIVGLPAVDTIKQVERTAHGALITSTIPREFIVLAQTPQGFRYDLLESAFAEATADGFVGTDEASVVERAGHPVAVVPGSQVNLKITQPGDLELAEFYLHQRMPAGARNLG
jgi:2-C-methyl-D-erythritol 4-phosphate cytidylyltransferase